jgi:hypothetical protein
MPPGVQTRSRDRQDAGNDSAAGHPAPGRGESDLSSSLASFASDAGGQPGGGKQLRNLRRQQARRGEVESSATPNSTSDEEWSPAGSGGRGRRKAPKKKRGGKAKKAGRAAPAGTAVGEERIASDGRLIITRPHDHDVLSGRGGGEQRKDIIA